MAKFLSLNAMDKILKNQQAVRVSEEAREALAEHLELIGSEISKLAVKYAEHGGRRTVLKQDIKLAVEKK